MRKNRVILISMAALFCFSVAYNLGLFSGKTQDDAKGRQTAGLPALKLGLLQKKHEPFQAVERDIFKAIQAKPAAEKIAKKPAPPPQPLAAAPEPPPPPSELQVFTADAKVMGSLEKRADKTVFIMKGGEVLTVKKGDQIYNRFRVEKISEDALILKDNSTGEEGRLPIVK